MGWEVRDSLGPGAAKASFMSTLVPCSFLAYICRLERGASKNVVHSRVGIS